MTNQKQRIVVALLQFFEPLQPGDQIKSQEIIKAVKRRLGIKYIREDTVLRYLRMLNKTGIISYKCECRHKMIYEVI